MSIDGRYLGDGLGVAGQAERIDLRIDVDAPTNAASRRVSADVFAVTPSGTTKEQFLHSWVVQTPNKTTRPDGKVEIKGPVTFLGTKEPPTQLVIEVDAATGKAVVTLTTTGAGSRSYACERRSAALRALELTLDVSQRAGALIQPMYHTSLLQGPPGMANRSLGLVEAFREAGIDLTLRSRSTALDDSDPEFLTWEDDELVEALATRFLQDRPDTTWPQFAVWGLLAGKHITDGVAGVMFDDVGQQQRQGFAVFRDHSDFAVLPAVLPAGSSDRNAAAAMRSYLFTWIHELGHALNLIHADGSTWMNNPHSSPTFWQRFRFGFVEDELLHLRHGALTDVIMGGADFKGDSDALDTAHANGEATFVALTSPNSPIQLTLRARSSYCFSGPVKIEARLHYTGVGTGKVSINTPLNPEFGRLAVFIQRPDTVVRRYAPLACKLATAKEETLTALHDDYLEAIDVTYGSGGFYFSKPGQYTIRAYYQLPDGTVIGSNALTVNVALPTSEDERFAQEFFSKDVGTCLYFRGSRAPRLRPAFEKLRAAADRRKKELIGADLAASIVQGLGKPFHGVDGDKVRRLETAKPDEVLALTNEAVNLYREAGDDIASLGYESLVYTRAACLKEANPAQAAVELAGLEARLVRQSSKRAISDVRAFIGKIAGRR